MSREAAIKKVEKLFDSGVFLTFWPRGLGIKAKARKNRKVRDHKVELHTLSRGSMQTTRLDPGNPWSKWAVASITKSMGNPPAVLPNLGGSLPSVCP